MNAGTNAYRTDNTMKPKESLLNKNKETLSIPRTKFFIGIASGLLFSFWLYAFLYMSREVFRFFSQTEYYDLLILSNREIFFYNLFFAFIAVIFGQSICFNYWFEKPRTLFHRSTWRRFSIVNDNRVLNWNFLSWFSKLAVVYGFFFCLTWNGGFIDFILFPDYSYIFALVVVVLYLQVWNTFRITFKKESKKWFLISLLVVSGLSFTFSQINFIDHKALNDKFLSKNIFAKYNLELPTSDYYRYGTERFSLIEKLFVVLIGENDKNSEPQIIYENQKIAINEIDSIVKFWRLIRSPAEADLIDVRLYIDKDVPMYFVNNLKEELSKNNSRRVSFVVYPADLKIEKLYEYYYSVPFILPPHGEDRRVIAKSFIETTNIDNIINLDIRNTGEFSLNGLVITENDLAKHIEEILRAEMKSMFLFSYSGSVSYSNFIFALSHIRRISYEIRNELALKEHGITFDELRLSEEYDGFVNKYPVLFFNFIYD